MNSRLLLSPKYTDFLKCDAQVEYLEGTTAAGKTTVGIFKFMLKVAESNQKLHIIAADDTGTAEKNIIQKDLGIMDVFGGLVRYNGNGSGSYKMPHLIFSTSNGEKVIFIVGYANKNKWRDALGGQYGCLYIDEINTANIDFIRESVMRSTYIMATLNPDDPSLAVYSEYINRSRPLAKWEHETPKEIMDELKEPANPNWVHWFFSFKDNLGLEKSRLQQIITNTPKGTKLWKNKIEGIRGKSTGLVFPNFDRKIHTVTAAWVHDQVKKGNISFRKFTCGIDTSYSAQSADTIAFIFQGITADRKIITLAEKTYSNAGLEIPLAPSDTALKLIDFLERCRHEWGIARDVFIDSADQATITELRKYKRLHGSMYNFFDAYKKTEIIDRINLQLGWIQQGCYLVTENCTEHLKEMDVYSWMEDKDKPEDKHDHTINASQYAWLPYKQMVGFEEETRNGVAE